VGRNEGEQFVRDLFEQARPHFTRLVNNFVDDAEVVVEEAETIFHGMIPEMAYVDDHENPMASSVFYPSGTLAVYLALRKRGVDVHDFGSTMLSAMVRPEPAEEPEGEQPSQEERVATLLAAGEASQREAVPGEFVFEVVPGDGPGVWRMNIKSCAVCHAFSKYDAMDLVPYLCATDDVISDRTNQGLRRTGTIALGANQCDFSYKRGGEPLRLVEQYPQQIRVDQG
jgi:type I restriction enzyme S subunit